MAKKFLREPWRWKEVWQGNPQVKNPDSYSIPATFFISPTAVTGSRSSV
ncbi:MAG: hypothetical protein GKR94_08540 [Gammaproteobacteria bacterium]|nr:hypothetical protein [Gammaproteobacteria bacterium]